MEISENQRVNEFLGDIQSIPPDEVEIVESIRRLFNEANHQLSEEIKYGGLVFLKSGSLVGGVFPYKKHISIEFSNGADFTDTSGLLEGKGKRRRHLKMYEAKDIKDKNVSFFVKQAISG